MKKSGPTKESLLAQVEDLKAEIQRLKSQASSITQSNSPSEVQMFRLVAEAAPVGIFLIQGTKFIYVNSALAGLGGLDAADMVGREYWEMVHPDDRALVRERGEARQQRADVPESYQVRFLNATGETCWASFHGKAINYQGQPAVLGFVQDITDNIHTYQMLEASEEKYRNLVESATEAIFSVDRNGIFLFMNKEAARQLGGRPEDFVGRSQWDIFPKPLADRQMKQIRNVFETGQGFAHEVTTVMQGKEHIHQTTGVPVRNIDGKIIAVLGIARDLTELTSLRLRLQKSEEDYRRFVDNLPVGVFQSTPEGRVLSANPAIARTFGCDSVEEYLAIPAADKWADPDHRRVWLQHLEQEGTVSDYPIKLKRKDGAYIWVSVSAQGRFDEHNRLVLIDGVEIDVTGRKRAEETLRRTGESMRALLNAPDNIMVMIDAQGTLLALNEAAAVVTGLPVEGALGTCAWNYMSEDLAVSRRQYAEEVFRTGRTARFEERVGDRYAHNSLHPVFDDQGRVEAVVISSADITEARRAREALLESEENYRRLYENAQAGIFRASLDGSRILSANRRAAEYLGYTVEEMLAHPQNHLWYDLGDHTEFMRLMQKDGFVSNFELAARSKSGEPRKQLLSARLYREAGYIEGSVIDITERYQNEQKLLESERKYRHLFENAQVAMFRSTLDGSRILAANERSAANLGYTVAEILELSAHQIWVDAEARAAFARRLQKDGFVRDLEMTTRCKDGTIRTSLISAQSYPEEGYLEGSALDITDQIEARRALEESEQMFRVLAEAAPVAIVINQGDKMVYANRTALDAVGVTASVLGEANFWEYVHPDHQHVVREFSQARQRGQAAPSTYELKLVGSSGEERWSLLSVSLINYNGRPASLGIAVDITERKLADIALKQREAQFRRITERSYDTIYHFDLNGTVTYMSPAGETLAGYPAEQVVGHNVCEFVDEKYVPDISKALAITSTGQNVEGILCELIAADGHTVFVEANAVPIIDDGRVIGAQAIVRDISARRRAEQMLREAHEEQSKQLRQVAGGLAHEVYNDIFPLSAAISKLRQTLENMNESDRARSERLLSLMDEAISRAIDATEEVSLYSKLRHEKGGEARLSQVLDSVLEHCRGRIKTQGVSVVKEVPEALMVACSERNLRSLFMNLVINALDAAPTSRKPALTISAKWQDGKVTCTFSDNGTGIPPENLSQVFDPFFSTKPSTGSGLGLAVVKRVVDISGGDITVDSALDIGTTFHILLPGDVGT